MTSFVFYDTETTGAQPRFDQVLQFAAIHTDEDFAELETVDVRSRLAAHIVPSAGALKVTGVDPFQIARAKHGPHEFASMVHGFFTRWAGAKGTAYMGFNSIRFDEEIMRQMFWENLLDPYVTSKKGSTRNDLLIFLRAIYARNPELIAIPRNPETGKNNFKLENVAPLNGFADHDAHDALGDVRATIHMAQLIRETDPDLFAQMMAMGDARAATDFVDSNIVFRMLGGPMLNPGILDVCLIASEATNTKNKSAWNLAVDPVPYLDLAPEDILAAMQKSGTPFRSVKCNKSPGIFPIGWEFLNRVSSDSFEPADPATIDMRAEMIRNHTGFQANVAEALRLRADSYGVPETLEEKIYSGFPSWDDKKRMEAFQFEPDWEKRLDIVRSIDKAEMRQLGVRAIFVNAPEALPPTLRDACANMIAETRHCLDLDRPWTTVGTLMAEVDAMLAEDPEDAEALNIRRWALETYPQASAWIPGQGVAVPEPAEVQQVSEAGEAQASGTPKAQEEHPVLPEPEVAEAASELVAAGAKAPAATSATAMAHFLDGLE